MNAESQPKKRTTRPKTTSEEQFVYRKRDQSAEIASLVWQTIGQVLYSYENKLASRLTSKILKHIYLKFI